MRSGFHRPELDILRFFAFALVFFCHTCSSIRGDVPAAFASLSRMGSYGVDIFFLLSAFLIAGLLVREKERSGTINARAFYMRRILRIWPVYFVFLGVTLVLSRFTPVQFPDGAIVPMLLFYGNFWIMLHGSFSPGGILWSVSVEEQFYLMSPLATRFLSRNGLIVLCGLLILAAIVARVALSAFVDPGDLWFCTLTRLDPIAIGILVCLLLNGRAPAFGPAVRIGLLLLGVLCLFVAAVPFHGADPDLSPLEATLAYPIADIGALSVFLAVLGAPIAWRPLVYLGQISYGLYVYHLFALDVAKVGILHATGTCPFWLRGAIGLALTVPLAAVSYKWLEMPFLRLKERFSPDAPHPAAIRLFEEERRSPASG